MKKTLMLIAALMLSAALGAQDYKSEEIEATPPFQGHCLLLQITLKHLSY